MRVHSHDTLQLNRLYLLEILALVEALTVLLDELVREDFLGLDACLSIIKCLGD